MPDTPAGKLVAALSDETVRWLLTEVADADPRILERVQALAVPANLDALVAAATARVEARLDELDWTVDEPATGTCVEEALSEFRSDRPDVLAEAATLIVLLEHLVDGSFDPAGTLAQRAASWLFELVREPVDLPRQAWGRIRAEVIDLIATEGNPAIEVMRALKAGGYPFADYALATLFDSADVVDIEKRILEQREKLSAAQSNTTSQLAKMQAELDAWNRAHLTLLSIHASVVGINALHQVQEP